MASDRPDISHFGSVNDAEATEASIFSSSE